MHRTISASLHAGICTVREAPSQMDLLVRALPGSPLPTARGALLAAPKPCCGAGDMRAPPVLLAHPPCYDGTSIMPRWHIHCAMLAHPPCHTGTSTTPRWHIHRATLARCPPPQPCPRNHPTHPWLGLCPVPWPWYRGMFSIITPTPAC